MSQRKWKTNVELITGEEAEIKLLEAQNKTLFYFTLLWD